MSFALTLFFAAAMAAGGPHDDLLVSTQWLADHLKDPNVVVVEVGGQSAGPQRIPGARFLPFASICRTVKGVPNELPPIDELQAAFRDLGVGNDAKIVLYSPNPLFAARAWFTLDYLGHGDRAALLDGGLAKWTAEKRPADVDRFARRNVSPARFDVNVAEKRIVTLEEMRQLYNEPTLDGRKVIFVDARHTDQFTGKQKGNQVGRAGHIPFAECFPWTANLTTEKVPVMKPAAQLREMYASLGITNEVMTVAYCRTGTEASLTYFVLRYLGYDVALYDGSFIEWSKQVDTKVAAQ